MCRECFVSTCPYTHAIEVCSGELGQYICELYLLLPRATKKRIVRSKVTVAPHTHIVDIDTFAWRVATTVIIPGMPPGSVCLQCVDHGLQQIWIGSDPNLCISESRHVMLFYG